MWKVDPTKMCRQHLLGEHNEMHAFAGTILKSQIFPRPKGAIRDFATTKYITWGYCEVHSIQDRHDELRVEMLRRGYTHDDNKLLPPFVSYECGCVSPSLSELELKRRCKNCKF